MITVSREVEFDAGHRVPGHESRCHSPHGHRYRVRVTCASGGPPVDSADLQRLMNSTVADPLDGGFIVFEGDTHMRQALLVGGLEWKIIHFPYVPTVDNVARWVWEQLEAPVACRYRDDLILRRVEVWETPTTSAAVLRESE